MDEQERARVAEIEARAEQHHAYWVASNGFSDVGYQLKHDKEWRALRLSLADDVPFLLALVQRLAGAADGQGE